MSDIDTIKDMEEIEETPKIYERPSTLSLMIPLFIIGGLLALILPVVFSDNIRELMGSMGAPDWYYQLSFMFLGALGLAGGIGMWTGKKWGWWVVTFYFLYAIVRNINALWTITTLLEGAAEREYMTQRFGRIAINLLFFLYFFIDDVTNYFGVRRLSGWSRFGILCGLAIVAYVVFGFIIPLLG